jgi:hypothetical protein
MQYGVKIVLDQILEERAEGYVEALGIGYGADFNIGIPPLIVPVECKNKKDHRESEGRARTDIIARFSDYPRQSPKILITSPVHYTQTARRLLDENNVQILEIPMDFNNLAELEAVLPKLREKLIRALYKFRHYEHYKPRKESPKNRRTRDRYIIFHRERGIFPLSFALFIPSFFFLVQRVIVYCLWTIRYYILLEREYLRYSFCNMCNISYIRLQYLQSSALIIYNVFDIPSPQELPGNVSYRLRPGRFMALFWQCS